MGTSAFEQAWEEDPWLREQIKVAQDVALLLREFGQPDESASSTVRAILAGSNLLDRDEKLYVMMVLCENFILDEAPQEVPAERACVEVLKAACRLAPVQRLMLMRDLALFEQYRSPSGESGARA